MSEREPPATRTPIEAAISIAPAGHGELVLYPTEGGAHFHLQADRIHERHADFEAERRETEGLASDLEHLKELEQIERASRQEGQR